MSTSQGTEEINIEQRQADHEAAQEQKDPRRKCCHKGMRFFDALMAMLSRVVFLGHGTGLLIYFEHVGKYYILGVFYALMLIEAMIILFVRRGVEWKWYSPCMLVYLGLNIPPLWLTENTRQDYLGYKALGNNTHLWTQAVPLQPWAFDWTWGHVQGMLVAIIFSRWLMPKGNMSRDALSALLILYLATAADIVDFFDMVEEGGQNAAGEQRTIFHVSLAVFTWSMLQFPFVRTATREIYNEEEEHLLQLAVSDSYTREYLNRPTQKLKRLAIWCFETETWALLIGIIFQDGPYFIFRLYILISMGTLNRDSLFYLVKNALILILQIYRIVSLGLEHRAKKEEARKEREKKVMKGSLVRNAMKNIRFQASVSKRKVGDSSKKPEDETSVVAEVS